ncbi:uncharacterized protein LOC105702567 [Orussus abietinus]|uniref:uncharacterized protein LOC105702567 n=1 Tax=Orussus abietinus TaxID=222816 RepID=UPI000625CEEC|nr:uncharacterized protein LOC105702567 [Orussus abietinus]XP_012285644.1 uncharacterized protein LOC105702567 [Orussus abietinus]
MATTVAQEGRFELPEEVEGRTNPGQPSLDKAFLERILQEVLRDRSARVLWLKKEQACKKGDNLLSELFRVSLRYSRTSEGHDRKQIEETINFIVKLEPATIGAGLKLIRDQELFSNELKVLRYVLPRIEKFVEQKLGPTLLYGSENPMLIVMEDLGTRGFALKNRQKGLSMAHTVMTIETIAKFHAGSVALYEEEPDLIRSFKRGVISEKSHANIFRLMEISLEKLSETWPEYGGDRACGKLKALASTITSRLLNVCKYDPDEFCVLNHGDCWINNMLFRENGKGEPIDLLMVDFQYSVYTSPAIDLLYFINICPEAKLKCDMDDFFLEHYLKVLKKYMKSIGCKTEPPTMEQLKRAMLKRRVYAVMSGLIYFPRMVADNDDIESFDEFLETGDTKMDIFKNPDVVTVFRKLITTMNDKGYLD